MCIEILSTAQNIEISITFHTTSSNQNLCSDLASINNDDNALIRSDSNFWFATRKNYQSLQEYVIIRSNPLEVLLCNFIEIALQHGCSPVNLLHIFRSPSPKNTSKGLLLSNVPMILSHPFIMLSFGWLLVFELLLWY